MAASSDAWKRFISSKEHLASRRNGVAARTQHELAGEPRFRPQFAGKTPGYKDVYKSLTTRRG